MRKFAVIARAFLKSNRANVAMMFALSLLPLMIGAGAGLDYARAMLVRQQMGEALDAAALAVGSTPGLTQSSAQALAQKYFDANYTVDKTEYGSPTISIPSSGYDSKGSVVITASSTMPTVLIKIAGINNISITTSSNVVWGQTKLWVSLVLDNSGSMSQGDSNGTKMDALKSAAGQLLTILQNAASHQGDVQAGIIPFTRLINMGASAYGGSASIDWGEWDAPPKAPGIDGNYAVPNVRFSNPATISFSAWGPGDKCPFTNSSNGQSFPSGKTNVFGFYCMPSGANQSSSNKISTIGSDGLICPGIDSGSYNTDREDFYYNGCYTSVEAVGSVMVAKGSSATCSGFSNCSCTGSGSGTTCSTTKIWLHSWVSNNHSSWSGCVTDRQRTGVQTMTTAGLRAAPIQNIDTTNTQPASGVPDTQFPAENPSSCPGASVTNLSYDWTTLASQITAMQPGGSTNQSIGVAHGWQMLTTGAPYGTPSVPDDVTRYIILLSDGLNTQNRWWGDGSTEGNTEDGYIDDHEKATCDAAKADGIVIYTIFLDIGGAHGNSAPLRYCASDATKYYDLTTTSAVVGTFKQIAQQITNVRVVK
jgi:Flp pilus assembly protein TadG